MKLELNIKQKAIGSGILFPFQITERKKGDYTVTGLYPVLGDEKLIENNIHSLMIHPVGFRFRFEEYGNRARVFLEEQNTQALTLLLKEHLRQIISTFETRIDLSTIEMAQYDCWLLTRLNYNLSGTPLEDYVDLALEKNI